VVSVPIDELVPKMDYKLFNCIFSVLTVDTHSNHENMNSVSHPNPS